MENKHSGLVTPPIVSPRPIQTQKPFSADDSWRIVGSPPRRPLLSPPEDHERERQRDRERELDRERERARFFQNSFDSAAPLTPNNTAPITTASNTNSKNRIHQDPFTTTTFLSSDQSDLTDSIISSTSLGTSTESSSSSSTASSASTPASPTTPQHKQPPPYRIQTGPHLNKASLGSPNTLESPRKFDLSLGKVTSPFALESPLAPLPLHFKSSSTGAIGSRQLDTSTQSSILSDARFADGISFNDRQPAMGLSRGSLKQNSSGSNNSGLESSLNLSSIWNGRSADPNVMSPGGSSDFVTIKARDSFPTLPLSRPTDSTHGNVRTGRSLSFSEPSFSFSHASVTSTLDQDEEDVLRYRPPLPTMEEESEDPFEPRMARARSFSTSAAQGNGFFSTGFSSRASLEDARVQDLFSGANPSFHDSKAAESEQRPFLHRKFSGGLSAWPNTAPTTEPMPANHRRSLTSGSGYRPGIWESPGSLQSLPPLTARDHTGDRISAPRRFSLEPSSGYQPFDSILENNEAVGPLSNSSSFNRSESDPVHQVPRRHSVSGLSGSYFRHNLAPFNLSTSLENLQLDEEADSHLWAGEDDLYETDEYSNNGPSAEESAKGMSLSELPTHGTLYVVEFKSGRSDLFYVTEDSGLALQNGDYVMVEADRGKDLGKITNDSITPEQIKVLQARQAEIAALQALQDGSGGGHRTPKDVQPKRIFRLANTSEISQLANKDQDELKAMVICQTKVRHKRLPMEVVNAEYQWDRRKLTFYFVAKRRIDFRELVRDLFKIYKTRIWILFMTNSHAGYLNCNSSIIITTSIH
ncbi:hypothetical protein BGZ83_004159 [Gryganskiella cystojenkinii]|nr:hypothetical protein BGZ83_004159 [Gryganskiella cystojenkinii]